ncbi:hypothetical protein B7P43_G01166 [Cryptotermes secundus]|nr:hypothetical protein B7P43_G01166 [Cryptotermes secundus]
MHHKLDKLVVGEMELRIGEDGVLCIRCANLLNYVDRIEVELNMLTKAILNSIRKKYGMGVRTSDKTLENLLSDIEEEEKDEQGNCGEKINMDLQLSLGEETSNQWTEHENGSVVSSYTSDTLDASATNKIHESPPSEEMQCHVCRFRTSYKSLMIFHLRQHMKDSYWCDFCNIPLPKGTVDWMGRNSVENHITNIDLDDQHVIADVQGDIVEQEVEANGNAVREVDGSDTSILPRSMDLMVTVLPVSAEVVGKIVPQKVIRSERIKSRRGTEDTVRLPNDNDKSSSSLNHMQSISNSGKCIRVLNEMGMIITQEVASSDEVKDSETVVSEEHTDSQIPSHTVKFTTLDLTVKPQAGDRSKDQHILCKYLVDSHSNKGSAITELELNMEHRQLLNEVAITEVTSEELQIDNLSGDASEMRVNVTPGMMTYSSHDRRLNAALVDNPSELNEEVVGVQN